MFTVQHDIIDNLLTLVDIDSPSGKEQDIVKYLVKRLKLYTKNVVVDNTYNIFPQGMGNVIGKIKGIKQKPPILLCAHMDTVQSNLGVVPIINHNIIKTDGTTILGADDKAGIAVILTVLKLLHKEKINHCPIEIVFTSSEEIGLIGSKNLNYKLLDSKSGFILDTDGNPGIVSICAPSHAVINIKVIGKGAHAAINTKDGINSIKIAADAIAEIPVGDVEKDVKINVGTIHGGEATNIIPEETTVQFEIRSFNDAKLKKYNSKIKKAFNAAAKKHKAKIEFESDLAYKKYEISSKSKSLAAYKDVCRFLKIPVKLEKSFGGSDASIFNQMGIEALNISTGYENPHSNDEYVKINNLCKTVDIIFNLIKYYTNN